MHDEDILVLLSTYRVLLNGGVESGGYRTRSQLRGVPLFLSGKCILWLRGLPLLVAERLLSLLRPRDQGVVLVARRRFWICLAGPSRTFVVLSLMKRMIVRL